MSAFNILITEIECPNCGQKHEARIQFKFGNTWQFEYKIGDTIAWGGNDIGNPNLGRIKVYGIIESITCPFCGKDKVPEEYDIFITDNVIKNVFPLESIHDYLNGNGEYVSLE